MLSFQSKDLVGRASPHPWTNCCKTHQPHATFRFLFNAISGHCRVAYPTISRSLVAKQKKTFCAAADSVQQVQEKNDVVVAEEEEDYEVITAMRSNFNDIVIVDTPKARMLLLDSSHNVHSILNKDQKWTGSYWDEFASLPAVIPPGPIAILGLGAGTAAHLMLDLWPSLELDGWDIDPILIDKARQYFGLSDLERPTAAGGILNIHVDDGLTPSGNDHGKFAGIVIDLFSEGKVLPQLQEVATWLALNERLMPNGRFMVNCGGINESSNNADGIVHPQSVDGSWFGNSTLKALSEAFPGQVNWKRMPETQGANYMALTGPLPDLTSWSSQVPPPLCENVKRWMPCISIS